MGHDPRLPRMPEKPTLFDFFKYRFGPANHVLQSARLAQKNGVSEKIVLACLLHDIAIAGFIRADHGYWAAQLLEPYVDAEVTLAIRYHQALRFFAGRDRGSARRGVRLLSPPAGNGLLRLPPGRDGADSCGSARTGRALPSSR